ncbi:unnamed protein product [Symbiodinium microadriaticum]|nr:unnamed protein product [Symbiodinium microadriaticum]
MNGRLHRKTSPADSKGFSLEEAPHGVHDLTAHNIGHNIQSFWTLAWVAAWAQLPGPEKSCGFGCHGLEVEGIPLDRYLDHFTGLGKQEQHEVIRRVMQEAGKSTSSGARAGVCKRKVARIGVLSWNVGISDHRKDQEEAQAAVADVLLRSLSSVQQT